MKLRFPFSLIACSLVISSFAYAAEETEEAAQVSSKVSKAPAQEPTKKQKPHFAGVRRPAPKPEQTEDTSKKPSRKVKNKWFSSKTQPKLEKKETIKEEPAELPSDRPYFRKTSNSLAASGGLLAQNAESLPRASAEREPATVDAYPRTGFQAPAGHVFFSADWLYWRVREEGMEFATSKQIEFDFQSGFRVAAGAHFPSSDGWGLGVSYTYFMPDGSHHAHGALYPLFLFQGSGVSGSAVTKAEGHWKVEFQTVDITLGKAYYLTQTLVMSPFFGIKGAWIDQHAHFHYEGGYIPSDQTFRTHFKNDFKGAGPLVGTEINWQLGGGFGLFADIASAAVIAQFDNEQRQYQESGMQVVHLDTDFNSVSPMLQMAAGLCWDRNFSRDRAHFGLSAGFETQYWWSQNQTEQFTDDLLPVYVRQKGDLAFYGLTLRARVDF